ncbi:MAG: SurA N-terminal domain-containing protein [Deltaproteobacteria bacterium]|jgi:peptidyl-prolyl cis-trans isomerase D|nr:SurA N-terminal domain-containing protein [Deltaproteobacteria bacterium]
MLKFIRQRSGGLFSIAIIGAIALVFIFWGVGGQDSSNQTTIKMDDFQVSLATFRNTQRNVLERTRQTTQNVSREAEAETYRQAMYILLERHVLLKMAESYNLKVSDAQLSATVKKDPAFQDDNGRFSLALYKDTVTKRYGQTLAGYESQIRESILIEQMTELIRNLAFIPRAQIVEEFHFARDKIALKYAHFKIDNFTEGLTPTEADISAYFTANQEKYRKPQEIKVQYVEAPISQFIETVEASEEEIKEAYELAQVEMTTPERAQVSHILVGFANAQNVTDEDRAATKAKAEAILVRAQSEDFATLAQEVSSDATTAANGGDLDWIVKGQALPVFDEAIFGPGIENLNKPIGPLPSPMGFHIMLVRAHEKPVTKTLEEAKEELTERVKTRKARNLAANKIEELEKSSRNAETMVAAAATLGLEPQTSDFFSTDLGAPSFLQVRDEDLQRAFRQEIGQLSFPVTTDSSYALYAVVDKKPSFIPPVTDTETKEKVERDWINDQAKQKASQATTAFLDKAQKEGWATALTALPEYVEQGQSPLFPRFELFTAGSPFIMADIATLAKSYTILVRPGEISPNAIPVTSSPEGFLAISLAELEPADETEIDAPGGYPSAPIRDRLKQAFYQHWLTKAMREVDLKVPTELQALMTGGQAS